MKTIKGPALFLAQFAGDEAPFNSWDSITKWAADCGYRGVQVPSWDGRLFDLARAAESRDYCDEFKGVAAANGIEVTELSTHLQGQLVAVHPAYDEAFDGFAAPEVRGNPKARQAWAVDQVKKAISASRNLGIGAHATFSGALAWELSAFRLDKRNYVFRDGDGFNVADGRTRHVGLELALQWQLTDRLRLETDQSFARHTWRFDRAVGQGEVIVAGRDTDSAPRRFGSTRLAWETLQGSRAELEWLSMGGYWLNAANTARYPGHELFHLRFVQPFGDGLHLGLRLQNLTGRAYAERADFAFGQYRYFPGRGRSLFLEFGWRER